MFGEKQNPKLPDSDLSIPARGHGLGGGVGSENGGTCIGTRSPHGHTADFWL